jgi:hypothetical protein
MPRGPAANPIAKRVPWAQRPTCAECGLKVRAPRPGDEKRCSRCREVLAKLYSALNPECEASAEDVKAFAAEYEVMPPGPWDTPRRPSATRGTSRPQRRPHGRRWKRSRRRTPLTGAR